MKKNYLILLVLIATFQATLQAQTVTIGTQIWQTTNLNVDTYSDGTPIPQVTDPTAWTALTTGAWCYYNNDPANGAIYGKLYNWYAVAGIYDAASLANPSLRKKLAPTGYHIPNDVEWTTMINFLDPNANSTVNIAGGILKEIGTTHWYSPNTDATNSFGFTAIPGGTHLTSGYFGGLGLAGYWWSFSEIDSDYAFTCGLSYNNSLLTKYVADKRQGFSARCLSNQSLKTEDHAMNLQVKLFPNPTKNLLHLQTATNSNLDKITITDLTGKVILTQTNNTNQVNVELLASGMYIIEAVSGQEKFTTKFIKE